MKNKYYTPSIEEFCVGFRYEFKHSEYPESNWVKYDTPEFNMEEEDCPLGKSDLFEYRVKYLDKADIEELGWMQTKEYSDETVFQFEIDDYLFYELTLQEDQIVIEKWYIQKLSIIPKGWGSVSAFIGTIKNYNELKKIMQILNIK